MKFHPSADFILNLAILLLDVFALAVMLSGLQFADGRLALSDGGVEAFRYFTVDSNVLLGLVCLPYLVLLLRGGEIPQWLRCLKLMGTTGTTLTMVITIGFLAPAMKGNFLSLYRGGNFFFHLVIPILGIVSFCCLREGRGLGLRATLIALIPVVVYAVCYLINILVHLEHGVVAEGTDWYGFLLFGLKSAPFAALAVIGLSWGLSLLLWLGGRR